MACEYCAEAIALEQPCMELLCRHKVHTECALREATANDILGMRCPSCRDFVVPRQMMDEAEAIHGEEGQAEVVKYMWEHDPQFKAGLQSLHEARLAARKATIAVGKKTKEMEAKLKTDIEPFVAEIKAKVRATKAAHKALPEQKELVKLARTYYTKQTNFVARWGVGMWRIRSALRDVAAARTLIGDYFAVRALRTSRGRQFNVRIE